MSPKTETKYLTPPEVIVRWKEMGFREFHLQTLANWRARGDASNKCAGPRYLKIGRFVYYPIPELEKFEAKYFGAGRLFSNTSQY